uniref:Uncharacterized protein n=1 Tax=Leersia perrieri TaxID=77586 RepID=A0A0D9VW85_9ORYZ
MVSANLSMELTGGSDEEFPLRRPRQQPPLPAFSRADVAAPPIGDRFSIAVYDSTSLKPSSSTTTSIASNGEGHRRGSPTWRWGRSPARLPDHKILEI